LFPLIFDTRILTELTKHSSQPGTQFDILSGIYFCIKENILESTLGNNERI